jgi:hypothetical protein
MERENSRKVTGIYFHKYLDRMSPPASPNKRPGVTIFFCAKRSHQSLLERILIWLQRQFLADMTRLTIAEDPGEEFAIRGHNTVTDADEDGIIFYDDVTKVDVLPEPGNFTIQIITPDLAVEMDFADADGVREALELFEAKKVLEVSLEAPNSVRIIPSLKNEGT